MSQTFHTKNISHAEGSEDDICTESIDPSMPCLGPIEECLSPTSYNKYMSYCEGNNTTACGSCSHSEGNNTAAYGPNLYAEGILTTVYGDSRDQGFDTLARGTHSHSEGLSTIRYGTTSHCDGILTIMEEPFGNYRYLGNKILFTEGSEIRITKDKCYDMKYFHKIKHLNLKTSINCFELKNLKNLKSLIVKEINKDNFNNLPKSLESLVIKNSEVSFNDCKNLPQLKFLSCYCDGVISENSYEYLSNIKELHLRHIQSEDESHANIYSSEYYKKLISEDKLYEEIPWSYLRSSSTAHAE
jgi:hypothetical protein